VIDRTALYCELAPPEKKRFSPRARVLRNLCFLMMTLAAPTARAAATGRVAITVDGPNGDRLRTELASALPAGLEVMDASSLAPALSRQRVANVSAAFATPRRRKALIAKLHRAARAIGADAVVLGAVPAGKERGGLEMQLLVVRISKRGAVLDETVRFAKGASRAARWRALMGGALDDLRAGSEPVAVEETKDEDDADKDPRAGAPGSSAEGSKEKADEKSDGKSAAKADDESNDKSRDESGESRVGQGHASPTDALLVAFVGLDLGGRQFHYNQRITSDNLRPFDLPSSALLPASPGAMLSAEFYPLARMFPGLLGDIGITASGRYNLAKAKIGNTTLDTKWYGWDVNLRGRYHLGERGASPSIGVEAGVGKLVFAFKGAAADTDRMPGVDYQYLRVGADGRIPLGRVDLLLGAAFRHLLDNGGSFGSHFPRASIAGLDASIGGALRLTKAIEARVALNYARFGATLHSRPGDTYIAGGALEQTVNLDLGVATFF
jgi:hypothetical protein